MRKIVNEFPFGTHAILRFTGESIRDSDEELNSHLAMNNEAT